MSSTMAESCSGNDTLDINVSCTGPWDKSSPSFAVMNYKSGCSKISGFKGHPFNVNGVKIDLKKWPQAIDQFLQTAKVTNLYLHIDVGARVEDIESVWQSFSLIQNHPEINLLKSIEYHCGSGSKSYPAADELFLCVLERSHKSVESIVLALEDRGGAMEDVWPQICSGIEQCPNLKSLAINTTNEFSGMVQALAGKPLTSLSIGGNIRIFESKDMDSATHPTEQAIFAICKGSTAVPGIKSLKMASVAEENGRSYLLNLAGLDSRSKESLQEIMVAHGHSDSQEAFADYYVAQLDRLPFEFPNLKVFHLDLRLNKQEMNEDLLLNTDFFNACNQTPNVDRRVVITCITVDSPHMFRGNLVESCEEAEIDVVFREKEPNSWGATLRKGHGTIELGQVKELPSEYWRMGGDGMSDLDEGFGIRMEDYGRGDEDK